MRAAVIGIGSNSVRLLVGETGGRFPRPVLRDREGTRLFAGLDEAGRLSEKAMALTAAAVGRMAEEARSAGAECLQVFATSAARDAVNGDCFRAQAEAAAGVPVRILSGTEEAELSFLGASMAAEDAAACGVIDIGGGSTEIAVGGPEGIRGAVSCQMGAVRLQRRLPIARKEDMRAVEQEAARILAETPGMDALPALPACWVGTGGTFNSLSVLSRGIPWENRSGVHGDVLREDRIREIGEALASVPLAERLRNPSIQPGRADIVIHGICILLAVMKGLGLETIRVSEAGNLDGWLRREYGKGNGGGRSDG